MKSFHSHSSDSSRLNESIESELCVYPDCTIFLDARPKLRWATNTVSSVQSSSQSQKRCLSDEDKTDDPDEQTENLPLSKRQNSLMNPKSNNDDDGDKQDDDDDDVQVIQHSVIDDEELDFL